MTWETVPLGSLAHLNPRSDSTTERATFLGMADLGEDGNTATGAPIDPTELKPGYTPFRDRDLLVAKITPCFENGKIGQAVLQTKLGWGSTEFHVVRPDIERIDDRYLLHYLRTPHVRAVGETRMTGSAGQRRVPIDFLRRLGVPLPPLPEQRRIAALLDEADALRNKRSEAAALLKDFPSARFQAYDKSDWRRSTVDEVADLQGGLTVNARRSSLSLSASYLRVANVFRASIDLGELKEIGVTESELDRTRLKLGDVLVVEGHGNVSEVGRAALVDQLPAAPLTHQNHLFRLRAHEDAMTGRFLELSINSPVAREYLGRVANTTSGLNTLNATSIRSLPIRVAPLAVQHEIEVDFAAASDSLRSAQSSQRTLDALFASLQHRAFRGEL